MVLKAYPSSYLTGHVYHVFQISDYQIFCVPKCTGSCNLIATCAKAIARGLIDIPTLTLSHTGTVVPVEMRQCPLSSPYMKNIEGVGWKVTWNLPFSQWSNDMLFFLLSVSKDPQLRIPQNGSEVWWGLTLCLRSHHSPPYGPHNCSIILSDWRKLAFICTFISFYDNKSQHE